MLALAGCDVENAPPPPEPPTVILRIEQTPRPARVGETVRLRAVVRDSLDRTLEYTRIVADRHFIELDSTTVRVRIPADSTLREGILTVSREGEVITASQFFFLDVRRR